jgi:DNA-binding SARP family transcriptional activator
VSARPQSSLRRFSAPGARDPASAQLELDLEGGFALGSATDARDLPLSAQRVLAFVALRDRPLLRTYVAGSLWPGSNEARAAASLRTSIWRLQKSSPRPIVASTRHIALSSAVEVDARQTMAAAHNVLTAARRSTEPDDLERLVAASDLLPDWYDEWVVADREHMREQRVHALETLCELLTAEARFSEAAQAGLAAIACDPLRESAHRALIHLHVAEGNAAEAVRRYEEYARLLERKLGLAPSKLMDDLVAGVVSANAVDAAYSSPVRQHPFR